MKRGEIWLVNLDPTIGAEIKKTRPAIIVSSDLVGILPLKLVVPLTDWKDRYSSAPWMVRLDPDEQNGLRKSSAADALQIRSISEQRLVKRLGVIPALQVAQIVQSVMHVLQR
ncbi:MAG: type II toxin-antitoxin system PemK/MazF family toxin [Anaerolineales bacterium]|nr:type II toxin-antitoxin system PemK/MazF family toxin [Anaerolineales bacterium]WKZ41391.1 MAG: type II toxin-antitoxin system PemK/MazF family toxin [Anaerolineales bacterium]